MTVCAGVKLGLLGEADVSRLEGVRRDSHREAIGRCVAFAVYQTVYNPPLLSGLQRWDDAEDTDCEFHVSHPLLLTSKQLALSADDSKSPADR